jgi:glycerol-3-phosphate acyltransferase PlsX
VEAALRAAREGFCDVVLVGDGAVLEQALKRRPYDTSRVRVVHAPEHVRSDEPPAEALRRKPQASIRVAFDLVKEGEAQAVVSAGHSGALMVAGKLALDTIAGIDRPAIATHLPHRRGTTVLLDSGANVDCKPRYLLQFARMGAVYTQTVLDREAPQVALLSNGSEPGKGNELTRQAFTLLEASDLLFAGNLEPRELLRGRADVVVCDGFVGNLVLKTAEAAGAHSRVLLKGSIGRSVLGRLGYLLLRGFFLDLARRTDYREVGGSLLLGLRGAAVVCHGSSSARTIQNGLRWAAQCAERGLVEKIDRAFERQADRHTASA